MAVFTDPFDALTNFQQALDTYRTSSWLDAVSAAVAPFRRSTCFAKAHNPEPRRERPWSKSRN